MICGACQEEIYSSGTVEWLATAKGIAMAETLRVVHVDCQYYHTDFNLIFDNDYYDHWLPLDQLVLYVDIALKMEWDSPRIMIQKIYRFIEERGKK